MDAWGIQYPGRAVQQGGPEYQHREYSRNGLPPVPGGGNEVRGGERETGDGSGAFLQGEKAGLGTVNVVWGVDGSRVAGGPYVDASWEGSGWEMALGNHASRQVAMNLQDSLTDHQVTAELPCRGVSGTGGNEDGGAG